MCGIRNGRAGLRAVSQSGDADGLAQSVPAGVQALHQENRGGQPARAGDALCTGQQVCSGEEEYAGAHTLATQSHTLTHIVSYYFNLITYLFLLRLLTSFGVSGHSSRPNTPPSTLTSSGKLLRECVKGSEQCVATPWVRIT